MKLKAKKDYFSLFGKTRLLTKGKVYTVINPNQQLRVFDDTGKWNNCYLDQFVPEDEVIK